MRAGKLGAFKENDITSLVMWALALLLYVIVERAKIKSNTNIYTTSFEKYFRVKGRIFRYELHNNLYC